MTVSAELAEALGEPRRRGSLDDVEHVVVLMQENRSFDHYYGTLRGVRGFADPAALPGVLAQPDGAGGRLPPFHLDTARVDGQRLPELDHTWEGTHAAWAGGRYDGWVAAKTGLTMAYYGRADVPYHHALADAFTLCDQYFCSVQGPTIPNRLYLLSGTIDPEGRAGGPATDNPEDYKPVYRWTTYPQRLQAAGVTWRVYANREVGDVTTGEDSYLGDYGDNPLWLFHAYHDSLAAADRAHRELADRGGVHGNWLPSSWRGRDAEYVLADFVADCHAGTLPRVSYLVSPYAYCEHPSARPVHGARYIDTVLRALFANPALWACTAVLLTYDENDGFFDHVPPPVPPPGTPLEFVRGEPIGLGPRVPMTVISPWSRGGWVCSEVFDHSSVIRFLERWTGVREPNISPWRRAVCGDLTAAFDFREHNAARPVLPDTAALQREADRRQANLPAPVLPDPAHRHTPAQQPGRRPARPLPYQPEVNATLDGGELVLRLCNRGSRPVTLTVYPGGPPTPYLVAPAATTTVRLSAAGGYDVLVLGPNGFLRRYRGGVGSEVSAPVEVKVTVGGSVSSPYLDWSATHVGTAGHDPVPVRLTDHLAARVAAETGAASAWVIPLRPGEIRTERRDPCAGAHGWYDLSWTIDGDPIFARRFAGHLENGAASLSQPY